MVCCTLIAGLLALFMRPFFALRANPLAWRPEADTWRTTPLPLIQKRMRSFNYALAGIRFALRHEPNMRIHLAMAILAISAGAWFSIDADDWRWLVVAIALVLSAEALNTAVEQCCNAISREFDPAIKAAKDVAAGAVLVNAICAALIGLSIFGPFLFVAGGHVLPGFQVLICGGGS